MAAEEKPPVTLALTIDTTESQADTLDLLARLKAVKGVNVSIQKVTVSFGTWNEQSALDLRTAIKETLKFRPAGVKVDTKLTSKEAVDREAMPRVTPMDEAIDGDGSVTTEQYPRFA